MALLSLVTLADTNIGLDHASFSYDGTTEALHDVSFAVRTGTMTALVGPSGSGKSTIAKLIAGYWDVDAGKITIDGKDVRDFKLDSLMKYSVVLTDCLFAFSIFLIFAVRSVWNRALN